MYIYIYVYYIYRYIYFSISLYVCMYIYIYIYICYTYVNRYIAALLANDGECLFTVGGGDDTAGSPHRAQIPQFELFELILLLEINKQFPVEQY